MHYGMTVCVFFGWGGNTSSQSLKMMCAFFKKKRALNLNSAPIQKAYTSQL